MAIQQQSASQGLGPGGPNPLFFGVSLAVAIAVVAGIASGGRGTVLGSNLLFRIVVGGITFAVVYAVVGALWFAWHRRTFKAVSKSDGHD